MEATFLSAASRSGSFLVETGLVGNEMGIVLGLAAAGCFAGDFKPGNCDILLREKCQSVHKVRGLILASLLGQMRLAGL